jgi:hypothetical protein
MGARALNTLRILAVCYGVLASGLILKILLIGPGEMPEPARAYLSWWYQQSRASVEQMAGWISLGATVLSIISAVGLLLLGRWARPLFAACLVALLFSELLLGLPVLKTPFEYFADSLLAILAGSIIALAYWSDAANEFRAQAT